LIDIKIKAAIRRGNNVAEEMLIGSDLFMLKKAAASRSIYTGNVACIRKVIKIITNSVRLYNSKLLFQKYSGPTMGCSGFGLRG
jgi:hypothetical protein